MALDGRQLQPRSTCRNEQPATPSHAGEVCHAAPLSEHSPLEVEQGVTETSAGGWYAVRSLSTEVDGHAGVEQLLLAILGVVTQGRELGMMPLADVA